MLTNREIQRVRIHFDNSRTMAPAQTAGWEATVDRTRRAKERIAVLACGGETQQMVGTDGEDYRR